MFHIESVISYIRWYINGFSSQFYIFNVIKSGKYRCEVEWSNEKKPFQITHDLKVLVAPTVKFIPSKQTINSVSGYGRTGNALTLKTL